ncbi:MAG TPA: hypothetical protein PLV92_20695, partial [Pirellulaceae bacterium]|nr:hypothetical protein [Pirellulaceae bacterium]
GAADTHAVAWEVRRGAQLVASGAGSQLAFTPSTTGTFVVSLTVTDDDGGSSSTSAQVEVRSAVLEADPTRPGQTVLYVTGGAGADVVQVQRTSLAGGAGGVIVRLNNRTEGQFAMPSRIVVLGGAGDDRISLDSRVTAIAELYGEAGNDQLGGSLNDDLLDGGDGNDVIYGGAGRDRIYGGAGDDVEYGEAGDDQLDGGSGNDRLFGGVGDDVIVGGTGEDLLSGQAGRNVLIGGAGADTLEGGVDEDLLIGGTTAFDSNATALAAVLSEWQSAGDFATRVARLRTGLPTGQRLRWNDTVFDDLAADTLTGGAGRDWHFARPTDSIRGLRAEDRVE